MEVFLQRICENQRARTIISNRTFQPILFAPGVFFVRLLCMLHCKVGGCINWSLRWRQSNSRVLDCFREDVHPRTSERGRTVDVSPARSHFGYYPPVCFCVVAFFVFVVGRGGLLVCFAVGFHWVGSFLFCSLAIQNVWILLTDNSLYSFGIALKKIFLLGMRQTTQKRTKTRDTERTRPQTNKEKELQSYTQKMPAVKALKIPSWRKKNDFPMFPAKEIPGRSQIPSITTR